MITQLITQHIDPLLQQPLLSTKPHILLGLSGGPDSVFLLHQLYPLHQSGIITLSAAHLNHGWRPEAALDVTFCEQLCKSLNIALHTALAKEAPKNGSQEALGRNLRRTFFAEIKQQCKADYVALAHHQQDQYETFFMRILRGCSLSGLTSIKPVQGYYIRPLLTVPKEQILAYLTTHNISYITDQSNESDLYLRNRIRHHVIPALKKTDARFNQKLETTLNLLEEENKFLEKLTQNAFAQTFSQHIGSQNIFVTLDPVLQKRLLITWLCHEKVLFTPSTGLLQEITKFLNSPQGGTHQLSAHWSIKKYKKKFWIQKITRS